MYNRYHSEKMLLGPQDQRIIAWLSIPSIVLTLCTLFACLAFFLRFRNTSVLLGRGYESSILMCISLWISATAHNLVFGVSWSCFSRTVVSFLSLLCAASITIERTALLYVYHVVQIESKEFLETKKEAMMRVSWERFFFYKRKLFRHGWVTVSKGIALSVVLMISIPLSFVFSRRPNVFEEGYQCMDAFYTIFTLGTVGIAILILAQLAISLRKVEENLGIKKEMKQLTILACICGSVAVFPGIINSIESRQAAFGLLLVYQIIIGLWMPIAFMIVSLVWPALLAKSRLDLLRSHVKSHQIGSATALKNILDDSQLFVAFEAFLVREFCSENLLFLKSVRIFEHQYETLSQPENKAAAKRIFLDFIDSSSPIEINISFQTKNDIIEALKESTITMNIFAKAFWEISTTIIQGPLARFELQRSQGHPWV